MIRLPKRLALWCAAPLLIILSTFLLFRHAVGPTAANASDVSVTVREVAQLDQAAILAQAALGQTSSTGTLVGVITVDGKPAALAPKVKKGDMSAKDAAICAANDVPDESLVVGAKGGLANVFVYLQAAPTGHKADAPPKEPAVFDQMGCRFLPHAMVIRMGQQVLVKSGDAIAHNTHTNPLRSTPFNQVVKPEDRVGIPLVYDKTERLPVKVVCDLHSWMTAYHLVLDHPFGAVTDADGKFEIKNLPAGKHTFVIWQERAGYLNRTQMADVAAGKSTELKLSFPAEKFK